MECLQEWPEPVVPVQALSESGASAVPDRYVKPLSDRPTGLSSPTGHEPNIPVVDLSGLSGGTVACRATIQAVAAACRDWGFFQVVNHGIGSDVIGRVRGAWRGFFNRPMEEKRRYANSPRSYEGYGSRLGVEKGAVLDWGDYYFLHLLPAKIKSQEKRWPENPAWCKAATEEYGREAAKLCGVLTKAMSIGLGLDAEFLGRAFGGEDGASACLRVNYYPKCPQPELTLGLSAHSDPGGLTVLLADERVAGLQVRKGDSWVTVQPLPGALIVNVGDQIQVLSNATYKSVEHRVVANAAAERLSLAFFYNPRSDLPVGPARELVTPDRPPLYQPMTFNEYRLYIRKNGPRGKAQLESLARGQVTN